MLIRKILIVGACDSRLVFPFAPQDVSVIGKEEELSWLKEASDKDFANMMFEVKAAVVIYNAEGAVIFKRLVQRGISCILILPSYYLERGKIKNSLLQSLHAEGARGIFSEGFIEKPLEVQEFHRQIKDLVN